MDDVNQRLAEFFAPESKDKAADCLERVANEHSGCFTEEDAFAVECAIAALRTPDQPTLSAPVDEVIERLIGCLSAALSEEGPSEREEAEGRSLLDSFSVGGANHALLNSLSRPKGEEMVELGVEAFISEADAIAVELDPEWTRDEVHADQRGHIRRLVQAIIAALGSSSLYEEDPK